MKRHRLPAKMERITKPLLVKQSTIAAAGLGVFAAKQFRKGEIIGEYTGEVVLEDEAFEKHAESEMDYLFDLGNGYVIDPANDPNPIKYINHSCNPNCESDQDGKRIFIRVIKTIKSGEELFYDYCLEPGDDDEDRYTCMWFRELQNIHPCTYVQGVLWYGVKAIL